MPSGVCKNDLKIFCSYNYNPFIKKLPNKLGGIYIGDKKVTISRDLNM
jgi:hypothetical protein